MYRLIFRTRSAISADSLLNQREAKMMWKCAVTHHWTLVNEYTEYLCHSFFLSSTSHKYLCYSQQMYAVCIKVRSSSWLQQRIIYTTSTHRNVALDGKKPILNVLNGLFILRLRKRVLCDRFGLDVMTGHQLNWIFFPAFNE